MVELAGGIWYPKYSLAATNKLFIFLAIPFQAWLPADCLSLCRNDCYTLLQVRRPCVLRHSLVDVRDLIVCWAMCSIHHNIRSADVQAGGAFTHQQIAAPCSCGWTGTCPRQSFLKISTHHNAPTHTVSQCLLHMPQVEFALRTAESTSKVQKLGQNWGMCSKHCNTLEILREDLLEHVMALQCVMPT